MKEPSKETFLSMLNELTGRATNKALREALGWDRGTYHIVRGGLLKEGLIKLGRGRGGTVHTASAVVGNQEIAQPGVVTDPFPEGWR